VVVAALNEMDFAPDDALAAVVRSPTDGHTHLVSADFSLYVPLPQPAPPAIRRSN